jgi:hypothetical protein
MMAGVLAIALSSLGLSAAAAEATHTVGRFLSDTASIAEVKCRDRGALERKYKEQGKMAEARSVKLAETMICDCMPNQVEELRASLSASALQQQMTEAEFQSQYAPRIVNKCAAEQLRSTYGEGCGEAFATRLKNSTAYCECMYQSLSRLPDSDIARIGSESADYVPRAAEAQRRGEPIPEQPPNLKRFSAVDAACRAK